MLVIGGCTGASQLRALDAGSQFVHFTSSISIGRQRKARLLAPPSTWEGAFGGPSLASSYFRIIVGNPSSPKLLSPHPSLRICLNV